MKKLAIVAGIMLAGVVIVSFDACQVRPLSPTDAVDQLFADWNRADSPGCSLGVSRNGVVVYERGYGMASLESRVPITPASVFHVASVSKQFTAMSILLLAKRGQISIDDEVRTYVPEWANRAERVTIRHLLSHTSGIRDGFTLLGLAAPNDGDVNEALVAMLARQRGLNFSPGGAFEYSNAGYTLLASIVRRVSGQSLRAFASENIFKPLEMTHTHVHDDASMIVADRAWGYVRDSAGLRAAVHGDLGHLVGTTGLFTTARDMLIWEQNFADARVGDPELLKLMQTPVLPTGWPDGSSYGFGLEIGQYRGQRTVAHGGGDPGYAAYAVRYPDQGLAIALLCNLENVGSTIGRLTERVADVYLADVLNPSDASGPAATAPAVALSTAQLASNTGLYRDPSNEALWRLSIRDGKLTLAAGVSANDPVFDLTPLSATRFAVSGTPAVLEFGPTTTGNRPEVRVTGAGPKPSVLQPLSAFTPSESELRMFAGAYESSELDVTYTLTVRNSTLVIVRPGRPAVSLAPVFRDAFQGSGVNLVTFVRDARGVVTGFTLNTSGVRGLRFDRSKP